MSQRKNTGLILLASFSLASGIQSTAFANQETAGPAASRSVIEHAVSRWRVFAGTSSQSGGSDLAAFAPNGRAFTVLVFRGVPDRGVNEYQLRLFQLNEDGRWSQRVLLTRETPGDDPAIARVHWINPDMISFLGGPGGMTPQVYTLDIKSERLIQRMHSNSAIISYDFSADGKTLVYAAHTAPDAARWTRVRLTGIIARPEDNGWSFGQAADRGPDVDLFLVREGDVAPRRLGSISTGGSLTAAELDHGHAIRVSPDGRNALVAPYFERPVPSSWNKYTNENVRLYLDSWRIPPAAFARIDLSSGDIVPLGVPVANLSRLEMAWSPDSRHAFIAGYLPPEDPRFAEIDQTSGAMLDFDLATSQVRVVAPGTATIAAIGEAGRSLTMIHEPSTWPSDEPRVLELVKVVKDGEVWQERERHTLPLEAIHRTSAISATSTHLVGITESSTRPTEVVVLDLVTGRSQTVTNLNPDLAKIPLGRVEPRIDLPQSPDPWPAQLVKPLGYVPGKRYPAVVMHMDRIGYAEGYLLDSADYRASYPIQALASRGIAVLMVWFPRSYWPPYGEEKRRRVREIADTAYDYLVTTLGLADPSAVAMTGFSHAGWVTEYGLQHTKRPYAAAVAIDNFTGTYFEYVLHNAPPFMEAFYDSTSPFEGQGRNLWRDEAVGFNPKKSRVPLLKESHGNNSPVASIAAWEVYAGRRRFHIPTELVYYPAGIHILRKVPEQISSAERQVDWLCFWLKGEEDPDPSKAEQYARWRTMKDEWKESRRLSPE